MHVNTFSEIWMDLSVLFMMSLSPALTNCSLFSLLLAVLRVEHALCSHKTVNAYTCLWFLGSREACNEGEGDPPLYVNVNMFTGQLMNTWIDSLQAFFPGLQVKQTLFLLKTA